MSINQGFVSFKKLLFTIGIPFSACILVHVVIVDQLVPEDGHDLVLAVPDQVHGHSGRSRGLLLVLVGLVLEPI